MRRTILAALCMIGSLSAIAQSKFNVSGTILDQETNEAVMAATVRVLSLPDSAMAGGAATDANGAFSIKNIKKGKYAVKITYIGYQERVMPLDLTNKEEGKNVNIGYIRITSDSKLLKEAQVVANVAQMQVSGDSLVYNAQAFRVAEGSALEDLVKKLPGAKVDDEGNITINGKTVSKILVDGKEFFLNDTKIAMKNIPTNMIDKLKTYDRKSDFSRVTGIDDGEEETVLDLSVKKGMNNGWFGNFDAGIGTENRYAESLMLNRFIDSNQFTILGGTNNTGDRGFGGGGGRGWGRGGNGLRSSKNAGFNFATSTDKLEAGGNIRFRYDGSDVWNQSSVQSFVTERGAFSNSESSNKSSANNWNADFRLEWKPDTMTNIIFRPSGSFSRSKGYNNSESASFNDNPYEVTDDPLGDAINHLKEVEGLLDLIINTNINRSQSFSENRRVAGELQANRRLNNEGRNITLRTTGNLSGSDSKQLSAAKIDYIMAGIDPNTNNRYYTTPGRNKAFSAQLTYSEPIAKKTYLQFSYKYDYSYNKSDREAFVMDATTYTDLAEALNRYRYNIDGAIDYLIDNNHKLFGADESDEANKLSQYSVYKNFNHTISLSFRKVTDEYNFSAGIDLLPQHSTLDYKYMGTEYPTVTRNVFNYAPNVDFRYNFDKQTNLRMSYHGRTSQPGMTNLLDITDDSNPLNITKGNPGLKPSFNHNVRLNFHTFQMEHQRGIFSWAGATMTQNSISNRTSYNTETGVRTTRPENINGNWNANVGGGFNMSLDKSNFFTVNNFTSLNYSHNVSYLDPKQYEEDKSKTNTIGVNENLGFEFRKDWFEMGINGSVNYNSSKNSVITTGNMETWSFSYGTEFNFTFNNGFAFSTDISESSRRGYASVSMNTNELLWNAQASMSFLKGNALTVTLQWNDILKNRSNISRAIDAYQSCDSRYNAIYSYGMVHVIYKLNIFGGKNANGTEHARGSWGGPFGGHPGGGGRR
ncbi:MAG: outer membrane beta-barrel protein [Bacteroidaceae bacterium]|nr:outer membrane beta-barrel protein [Bacteroidaceae bacterium]